MTDMTLVLCLAVILLSATVHLVAELRGVRPGVLVAKPLTVALILVLALLGDGQAATAPWLVPAGVCCSLCGDVVLMLRSRRLLPAMAAFFVAHLCYLAAFLQSPSLLLIIPAIPLAAFGVHLIRLLQPPRGPLLWGVRIYGTALLLMFLAVTNRWIAESTPEAGIAFFGGLLFVISDALVGVNEFRRRLPWSGPVLLGAYYLAQVCLVLGANRFLPF